MKIYLIGYMYSGKTTFGRKLANRLGYTFHDLDVAFEQRFHTTLPIFFARYGESAFRQLERQMLHATADMDDVVVSTGGGTPCHFDNMTWINAHGTSLYLETNPELIFARMETSRKQRPTLSHMTPEERIDFIVRQLADRQEYYRQANLCVPADNPDADKIISLLISNQQ